MAPDLLHLTLVFLGNTDSERVPDIASALARVAQRQAPFDAAISGAGGRVDDRPNARRGGVVWLTLADGAPETSALMLDVDRELDSRTYDEKHRPRPHLTVARNARSETLAALRQAASTLRIGWPVDRIVLFRSHTGPRGSRYEELSSHALLGSR